jgi:hypothetical protein
MKEKIIDNHITMGPNIIFRKKREMSQDIKRNIPNNILPFLYLVNLPLIRLTSQSRQNNTKY